MNKNSYDCFDAVIAHYESIIEQQRHHYISELQELRSKMAELEPETPREIYILSTCMGFISENIAKKLEALDDDE